LVDSVESMMMHGLANPKSKNVYRGLLGKPEKWRQFERPRRRWKGYIRMDLQEVEFGEGMDWIKLAQDRDWW
jgi:hypothetical protein